MTTTTESSPADLKLEGVDRKSLNLWQKLAYIKTQVRSIPKRGFNEHFRYNFVQAADVYDVVGQLMGLIGVVLLPKGVEVVSEREARSGSILCLKFRWEFINADEPSQREAFESMGEGQDSGDKRSYKATTGAEKYALISAFQVPTGLDPERDEPKASNDSGGRQGQKSSGQQRGGQGSKGGQQTATSTQKPAAENKPQPVAQAEAAVRELTTVQFGKWNNVAVREIPNEELPQAYAHLLKSKTHPQWESFKAKAQRYMNAIQAEAHRRGIKLPAEQQNASAA